jgi:hypothetical protein
MANDTFVSRSRAFIALCAALILLSIVAHLMADVAWGSPYRPIGVGLQYPACHLLDSLALPAPVVLLAMAIAIFVLSSPGLLCRDWLFAPPVRPPLYAS